MPGCSPNKKIPHAEKKNADLFPSPVFGLAKIDENIDFIRSLDVILQSVMQKFWSKFAKLCHYGHKNEELMNNNLGFPFFIYIISQKKTDQAGILLRKYPKFAKLLSPTKWSPLHEAVYQQDSKLIHILMRLGADPDLVGSRDSIEDHSSIEYLFGTKCVSAKTMTETLFKNMKLYIDFEIDHRNSITSTDMHHICTNFCTEDLKKYEIKWKKENSADDLEDILSEDDMVETIELEETVNKIPDNANKSK